MNAWEESELACYCHALSHLIHHKRHSCRRDYQINFNKLIKSSLLHNCIIVHTDSVSLRQKKCTYAHKLSLTCRTLRRAVSATRVLHIKTAVNPAKTSAHTPLWLSSNKAQTCTHTLTQSDFLHQASHHQAVSLRESHRANLRGSNDTKHMCEPPTARHRQAC